MELKKLAPRASQTAAGAEFEDGDLVVVRVLQRDDAYVTNAGRASPMLEVAMVRASDGLLDPKCRFWGNARDQLAELLEEGEASALIYRTGPTRHGSGRNWTGFDVPDDDAQWAAAEKVLPLLADLDGQGKDAGAANPRSRPKQAPKAAATPAPF